MRLSDLFSTNVNAKSYLSDLSSSEINYFETIRVSGLRAIDSLYTDTVINKEKVNQLATEFLDYYISDTIQNSEAKVNSANYKSKIVSIAIRQYHIDVFNHKFKEHGYRLETYINTNPDSPGCMVKGFTNTNNEPFHTNTSGTFGTHTNNLEDQRKFLDMLEGFVETTGTDRGNFLNTNHRNYERVSRNFTGIMDDPDLSWMREVFILPNMSSSGDLTPIATDWEESNYDSAIMVQYGNTIKKAFDKIKNTEKDEKGKGKASDDNDPKGSGSGLGGSSSGGGMDPSSSGPSQISGSHRNELSLKELILYNAYIILSGIMDNLDILLNNQLFM